MKAKTFEQFIEEAKAQANSVTEFASEFYEAPVTANFTKMTAAHFEIFRITFIQLIKTEYRTGFIEHKEHVETYIYDTKQSCFIKGQVSKKGLKVNKGQPKKPITLDNYQFMSENSPSIKGIGKGWKMFKVIGSSFEGAHNED